MKKVCIKIVASIDGVGECSYPIGLDHFDFSYAANDVKMVASDLLEASLEKRQITQEEFDNGIQFCH